METLDIGVYWGASRTQWGLLESLGFQKAPLEGAPMSGGKMVRMDASLFLEVEGLCVGSLVRKPDGLYGLYRPYGD